MEQLDKSAIKRIANFMDEEKIRAEQGVPALITLAVTAMMGLGMNSKAIVEFVHSVAVTLERLSQPEDVGELLKEIFHGK
jgi:hypothetical protein